MRAVLSDMLTDALGVGWDGAVTAKGMAKHEITGVPEALMAEFSQRVAMIHARRDELIAAFIPAHGREPTPVEKVRLAQQANLETRPDKQHRSLSVMTEEWRDRAASYLDTDPVSFVTSLKDRNDLPSLRADDLATDMLAEVASLATSKTAERHRRLLGRTSWPRSTASSMGCTSPVPTTGSWSQSGRPT